MLRVLYLSCLDVPVYNKFLDKRSEAVLRSLVVLVSFKLEPLKKLAWEVEFSTLWRKHHGRQLAVYLTALMGQYLEADVTLCCNTMGTEAVQLLFLELKLLTLQLLTARPLNCCWRLHSSDITFYIWPEDKVFVNNINCMCSDPDVYWELV